MLIHLPVTEAARQIQALVTALQRNPGFTKPTQQAIVAADAAARAVQKALEPAAGLQAALRDARQQRDALGPTWQKALEALKRGARAAIDDGEPYLYATLFPPAPRAASRNGKAAPNGSPTPTPPAPVAPPVSSTT